MLSDHPTTLDQAIRSAETAYQLLRFTGDQKDETAYQLLRFTGDQKDETEYQLLRFTGDQKVETEYQLLRFTGDQKVETEYPRPREAPKLTKLNTEEWQHLRQTGGCFACR